MAKQVKAAAQPQEEKPTRVAAASPDVELKPTSKNSAELVSSLLEQESIISITTEEDLTNLMTKMRKAQAKFATFTQEQVDKIFFAAAMAADNARIPLAQVAVAETGMGLVEDKVIKNHFAAEYIYNAYRRTKTCGVIFEDKSYGMKHIAEPIGIVAAVIPTTNPTSTAIFKSLLCIKTRNAIIISPHPRARKATLAAARVVRKAAEAAGLPQDILVCIDTPSIELTNLLMQKADIILATGGPGMVKAAYSSGKPALGVGPGNNPAIIDDSADIKLSVNSIIHSKVFDYGTICASENSVIVVDSVYDQVKDEFARRGCYFLQGDDIAKVGNTVIKNGNINAAIVGKPAPYIAQMADVTVPERTKILMAEVTSVEPEEPWSHEKLSPVLAFYRAKDFNTAVSMAERLIAEGGYGHTASLFINTNEHEKLEKYENAMKTCRVLINTPAAQGGIGDIYNFMLTPSLTLGCGAWGGNSVCGNVGVMNLLNIKQVAQRRENMLWLQTPDKVYFKKGCMPEALKELKYKLNKKRVFIITDQFLYKSGFTKPIESTLDELGIVHSCFWNVEPDPSLQSAEEGLQQLRAFEPDTIMAIGGGSAMDCGKIIWFLYENPEESFANMAADFMDIRKRVYEFPQMGKKAYFVAIPTSSGTGSEVSPYAIITDKTTGVKWPIADYELMPDMAIVDTDNMMTQPRGLTSASGADAMTHCLESYVSTLASDYTEPLSLKGFKLIIDYLPTAYNEPNNVEARDHMANASCIAGLAFSNAFLGLVHSMAHKLGAFHHIPHGWANGLLLCRVMRYNAAEKPTRMGTFPQYAYPHAKERYCEMARYIGITGANDDEVFEKLIEKVQSTLDTVGVKRTIAEYNVDEKYFLDTLDEMAEQAFNDQCTVSNPRYPLIEEIKNLYLDAYYGRTPSFYEE